MYGVNDDRWSDLPRTEPLVSESSTFEVDMGVENWKRFKSSVHQISALSIHQAVGHCILRSINLLILPGIRKNQFNCGRSLLL